MKTRILVAAVFLMGCAVGGVSSQLVVPKASAQQAATLTRWEVLCMANTWTELKSSLPEAGAQGWELVNHTREGSSATACFKRPKM